MARSAAFAGASTSHARVGLHVGRTYASVRDASSTRSRSTPRVPSAHRGVEKRASSPSVFDPTMRIASSCTVRFARHSRRVLRHGASVVQASSAAQEGADGSAAEDAVSHEKISGTGTVDPRRSTPLLPPAVPLDDWRNEIFARRPCRPTLPAEERATVRSSHDKRRLPSADAVDGMFSISTSFFSFFFFFFFPSLAVPRGSSSSNRGDFSPSDPSHRGGSDYLSHSFPRKGADLDVDRRGEASLASTGGGGRRRGAGFDTVISWGLVAHESTRGPLIGRGNEVDRVERCDRDVLPPSPQRTSRYSQGSSSSWTVGKISFVGTFWVSSHHLRYLRVLPTLGVPFGSDVDWIPRAVGISPTPMVHVVGIPLQWCGWCDPSDRHRMTHRIS